jgi:DNA repair protein RecO (recombination protein O)
LGIIKTSAIVLRYTNYRDYDRILTLFSGEYGKMVAASHACRRPKSPLLPGSQLFCFCEYVLRQKGERLSVMQCEIMDSFFDLGTRIEIFAHATFILNICEELSTQGEGNPELFALLIRSLSALCYTNRDPLEVAVYFLLNVMDITGYKPCLDRCAVCGREGVWPYFSTQYGGTVCDKCRGAHTVKTNESTLETINLYLATGMEDLPEIKKDTLNQIMALIYPYMEYRLERRFKSGDFMRLLAQTECNS